MVRAERLQAATQYMRVPADVTTALVRTHTSTNATGAWMMITTRFKPGLSEQTTKGSHPDFDPPQGSMNLLDSGDCLCALCSNYCTH